MKRYSNPAETRKSTSLGNDLGEHNAMLAVIGHHILSETLPNAPTYVNPGAEPEDVCVLGCPLIVHHTCNQMTLAICGQVASKAIFKRLWGIDRSHPTTGSLMPPPIATANFEQQIFRLTYKLNFSRWYAWSVVQLLVNSIASCSNIFSLFTCLVSTVSEARSYDCLSCLVEISWSCLLPSNLGKRNTVTVARYLLWTLDHTSSQTVGIYTGLT